MTELKLQNCRIDGRYDVLDCLGRGSYAEIYVAKDSAVSNEPSPSVVIKALNIKLQGELDAELEHTLIENFQNEAIALDRVRHQNIINRLGHGTAIDLSGNTFHYLVLEYMTGGDLAAFSRQNPLGFNRALFYLEQVCAGLAHAHSLGVIHRDIKPQNLLLTADRQIIKIADFGVAKLEATEGAITRVGTNIYAAPEHNPLVQTGALDSYYPTGIGNQMLTPAADIYSLAKTTYALLAGESPRRFAHRPISDLPPFLADKVWASSLLKVLNHATQNAPSERYQTVQEFWARLADAGLPPTQLLDPHTETIVRRDHGRDLFASPEVISKAPPKPRFETSRLIQQSYNRGNGGGHPRIVVPVGETEHIEDKRRQDAKGIIDALPDRSSDKIGPLRSQPGAKSSSRQSTRLLVGLFLIVAFAGMLFALHTYIRAHSGQAATGTAPQGFQFVGQEGTVVSTDVKLRPYPNTSNAEIGVAEQGSRVRVLNSNNNWYEVVVLQHGRDKGDPTSSDRGWINKRYLKFDQ